MSERIPIQVKPDHLAQLSNARTPLDALAELIWNAFDADSTKVVVSFEENALGSLDVIRITDNGHGIFQPDAKKLFGDLGDSWKKSKRRTDGGRGIHGKNGKGRFKGFYLGSLVRWQTTYRALDGKLYDYTISGDLSKLEGFDPSDPKPAKGTTTGTEVVIQNPHRNFRSLIDEEARLAIAQLFGAYLTEYPSVHLVYNGERVDPKTAQVRTAEVKFDAAMPNGGTLPVSLRIIEWKQDTDRMLHLCDGGGVSLSSQILGPAVKAKGFNFTAYLKADVVRDLDKENRLELGDLDPTVKALTQAGKDTLRTYFKKREQEEASALVAKWKAEKIYPYEEKEAIDPVEFAERQVFDILAANVTEYLKTFDENDTSSKRFTFRLIAQAVRENPESLQKIISDVLNLNKEDQDNLAELLKKTTLPQIIASAQIVSNRLNFLRGLEILIFDKEAKEQLLERDQLHKILEKEAWLFDENFHLAASEQWLEDVLNKHLALLGERADPLDAQITTEAGKRGRIDLMLNRTVQPRKGEYEHLVIELKRPSKTIDLAVLAQVKQYAGAVARDDRFLNTKTRWQFWVIGNAFTDDASAEADQDGREKGIVHQKGNIVVRAKSWGEMIDGARARLSFYQQQLAFEADRDSAKTYLARYHEKYLPPAVSQVAEAIAGAETETPAPIQPTGPAMEKSTPNETVLVDPHGASQPQPPKA
eukprot:TRINITY_DN93956_c0_g1_i1.p1 TRINITY_DN93956_c0_g1~~TRINITY_DN93956_c0_g1_i1.p1  ORF type:complete len:703 (+),score=98.65 TRINITY_DN93956_c0_g1_i1:129-2237(+)